MIDLHCHILPGIDDGADTIEDSLKMAEKAVSQGITHILCTPHHQNGKYLNPKSRVIDKVSELQAVFDEKKIPLEVFEGQEIRLYRHLVEDIEKNQILFCDMNNRYLLIEFPSNEIPDYAYDTLQDLVTMGKQPIIVHPERNGGFIKEPNELIRYLDLGCLAQLTAPSIVGKFGTKIQKTANLMVKHNLVQMVASDAHGVDKRNFYMAEAKEYIGKKYGEEQYRYMEEVTKSVFNGDPVELRDVKKIKGGLFGFL